LPLVLSADEVIGFLRAVKGTRNRVALIPLRHLGENFFRKLKQFRRIATRYEKTGASFAAMIHLAATVLAL